ncbi:MAG: hypothetical protein ACOYB3_12860 [Azonexus sp.]
MAIAILAVLSASSASAEWRGNQPCSGKEGVVGSCINRIITRSNESPRLGKAECTTSAGPAMSTTASSASPKVAANGRNGH